MNRRNLLRILPIVGALVGSACIAGRAAAQTIQYTLTWTTQGCPGGNTIGEIVTRPSGTVIFNVTSPGFLINNSARCDGKDYRLTNIAVGSLGNQTAGPIILSGSMPTGFNNAEVQVVVDPAASPGNIAGISKESSSNYKIKVRFQPSLNPIAPGVNITGPIVCDSIETFAQTTGAMTSAGRLEVTSTGPGTQLLFGSIQKRTDSLPSIRVGTATTSLSVRTTGNSSNGNMNGNVLVNSVINPDETGFQIISNNGNIGGNIEVGNGEITLVQARNGDIVNPAEFPSGQTWNNTRPADTFANRLTIKSKSRIRTVEAKRIAAVINADSDNSGGGRVDSIKAGGTTPANSAGFYGSVNADKLERDPLTSPALEVAGVLKANITLTGSGNVNSPIVINQFASTTTLGAIAAPISISSASTGSLTLGNLAAAGSLTVGGTLGVPLTIASTASGSAVNINTLPSAGLVRIAGNHAGALNFGSTNKRTTVKGLDGQVVINAGNGAGTWSGVVRVNGALGTALAPVPNYSNLASALGTDADGGAVGVAPFRVHALASFPPTVVLTSGVVVPGELRRWRSIGTPEASPCTPGNYPINVVKIEHYGPISNANTEVGLVDIQRRCISGGEWTRAEELSTTIPGSSASLWDIQILPGVGGQPGRTLAIRPKSVYVSTLATQGGQFRVTPLGDLKSTGLLNKQTAGVGWTEFFFNLRQANPSDIAGAGQSQGPDGDRTADDIIVFNNRFFAGDCRADIAGPGQSRVPDGELTADDIINFNNMFFSVTPCYPLPAQNPSNPPVGL